MKKVISGKILILSLVTLISIFSGAMISPIETRFLSKVTGSNTMASFAFTIATLASMLGTMMLSRMANKYGRTKVIYSVFMVSALFPLFYSLLQNTLQAYGVKFAWAFATAGTGTLMRAFIQDELSDLKGMEGTFFGILYCLQSITGAAGCLIGGYISDRFGFNGVFLCIFLVNLVQALMLIVFYKQSKNKNVEASEDKPKANIIEGAKYIWKNKILRARFVLIAVFGINWSTKAILYPLILFAASGLNSVIGAVFSTQGVVAFIVLPFVGKMVDKLGYSRVLFSGYLLLGAGVLTFSLSPYLWLVWLASGVIAAGEACNGPAMSKLETVNIPGYLRNSVVAVQDVLSTIVELIATFLTGILLLQLNPKAIMFIMSVMTFISIAISAFITRNTRETVQDFYFKS